MAGSAGLYLCDRALGTAELWVGQCLSAGNNGHHAAYRQKKGHSLVLARAPAGGRSARMVSAKQAIYLRGAVYKPTTLYSSFLLEAAYSGATPFTAVQDLPETNPLQGIRFALSHIGWRDHNHYFVPSVSLSIWSRKCFQKCVSSLGCSYPIRSDWVDHIQMSLNNSARFTSRLACAAFSSVSLSPDHPAPVHRSKFGNFLRQAFKGREGP